MIILATLNHLFGENWGLKSEFALPQTKSRLFHPVEFIRCWQIYCELNSKLLYQTSGKAGKRKVLSCLISRFVLDKTWNSRCGRAVTTKKSTKKRDAHAKLLFCKINLLLFCCYRCRRRHRCLSSLLLWLGYFLAAHSIWLASNQNLRAAPPPNKTALAR